MLLCEQENEKSKGGARCQGRRKNKKTTRSKGRGFVLVNHIVGPRFPCLSGARTKLQLLNLYSRLLAFVMLSWCFRDAFVITIDLRFIHVPSSTPAFFSSGGGSCFPLRAKHEQVIEVNVWGHLQGIELIGANKPTVVQVDKFRRHWRSKPQTCPISLSLSPVATLSVLRSSALRFLVTRSGTMTTFSGLNLGMQQGKQGPWKVLWHVLRV